MSITIVQSKTASASGVSSLTVTLDATTTAGNLLIALVGYGNNATSRTPSTPSGWTLAALAQQGARTNDCAIYYYANAPAIGSESFGISGVAGIVATILEVSGIITSSPLDKTATNTSAGSASLTTGTTATTAQASELAVYVFETDYPAGSATWTSGETEVGDVNLGPAWGGSTNAYEILSATAAVSGAATYSGSGAFAGAVATFKATLATTMGADAGSYTRTGVDASLLQGYGVVGTAGSYAITGFDVPGSPWQLMAEAGSYSLTGVDASLLQGYLPLAADAGSYALTGVDAALGQGKSVAAAAGSYALTGIPATLTVTPLPTYTGVPVLTLLRHASAMDVVAHPARSFATSTKRSYTVGGA